MRRHLRLGPLVVLILAVAATAAPAAPFAYVTNSGSSSVSVVDAATNTVSGPPIPVRGVPGPVAINATATRVYVASHSAGTPANVVFVIDPAAHAVVAEIPLPLNSPTGLAVSPDGTRLYVTHFLFRGSTVTVIDATTNTVLRSAPVGLFPAGVVAHPGGRKVYVATSGYVAVVDPETLVEVGVGRIMVGSRPFGLALSRDGSRLYVANNGGSTTSAAGSISIVDTTTDTVVGEVFVGNAPYALSVSPDGTRVFVGNQSSRSLSVVDAVNQVELLEAPLGTAPYGVQAGPDGSTVYVADFANNALLVIAAATGAILQRIPVGSLPIAFGEFLRSTSVETTLGSGSVTPAEVILGSAGPVTLRATLRRRDSGAGIGGATVEFQMGGTAVGAATTGADGAAVLTFDPSALGVGAYAFSARFAGGTLGGVMYGESAAAVGALQVVYRFTGFLPPLGAGVNEQKAGSMVPAKWRLANAAGAAIGSLTTVRSVLAGAMACGGTPAAWTPAGGTLSYDSAENMFKFQWKTEKTLAGQCARLALALDDGTVHTADFSFR